MKKRRKKIDQEIGYCPAVDIFEKKLVVVVVESSFFSTKAKKLVFKIKLHKIKKGDSPISTKEGRKSD